MLLGFLFMKSNLLRKYQQLKKEEITPQDFKNILATQGGVCPICGRNQRQVRRKLAIDHCHKTGRIRGILCGRCNLALGLLGDNCVFLERAINYLKQNSDWEYTTLDTLLEYGNEFSAI